jgi:hypothetical protein
MIIHVVMDVSRLKIGSTLWNALRTSNIYIFFNFFFNASYLDASKMASKKIILNSSF